MEGSARIAPGPGGRRHVKTGAVIDEGRPSPAGRACHHVGPGLRATIRPRFVPGSGDLGGRMHEKVKEVKEGTADRTVQGWLPRGGRPLPTPSIPLYTY